MSHCDGSVSLHCERMGEMNAKIMLRMALALCLLAAVCSCHSAVHEVNVAFGAFHTVTLAADGTVWALGRNWSGQLGDNTTTNRLAPVRAVGPQGTGCLTGIVAVSACRQHTVALRYDGTVWTWGANSSGQLGDGTTVNRSRPVRVSGLTSVTAVAAGENHTLALDSDGTVWAWGGNWSGELGDGTTASSSTPVQVSGLTNVTAVAAGVSSSAAVRSDGTVWTWGDNEVGQLGDGTRVNRSTPVQVAGLTGATSVSVGSSHMVAVRNDDILWAWGGNWYGQLGDGTTTDRLSPVQVQGISQAVAVSAGHNHAIVLRSDGSVWTWGRNQHGQLGDGTIISKLTPVQVPGLSGIEVIATGESNTAAVALDGTLWIWGSNSSGQIGDGTAIDRYMPMQIAWTFVPSRATAVAAGDYHSLAVSSDGTVWAWGGNWHGQLGDGTSITRLSPVQVPGMANVAQIACGDFHSVALKSDGTPWAWGDNSHGQLGDGTTAGRYTPGQISGLANVERMTGGGYHSIALKSDGTVWTWGANWHGQLGDGSNTHRFTPVQIPSFANVAQIAGGYYHSIALSNDGAVWAWGFNYAGQLGDGSTASRNSPVRVVGPGGSGYLAGAVAIAAGRYHSLAVRSDGTAWAWGQNVAGQLGDGTTTERLVPTQVSGLTGVVAVAAGEYHSLALKNDGTVWAWGLGGSGQIGDGTGADRYTPVQVADPGGAGYLTGVVAVAAASRQSFAVRSDGTVWAWGNNEYGRIGDGTTANRYSPVQVLIGRPSVTIDQSVGQSDPTNQSPVSSDVVFSAPVIGFDQSDVSVSGVSGEWSVTVTDIGDHINYRVLVSVTGSGNLCVSIPAGVAHDAAGMPNLASTSTDACVVFDLIPPSVTINQAAGQKDPTNASPINFTVVFSEPVSGFTAEGVTLGGSAGATTVGVTGSGTTYNVAVSGMQQTGTVTASIAAGVAHDAFGNGNLASTSTDNTVEFYSTTSTPAAVKLLADGVQTGLVIGTVTYTGQGFFYMESPDRCAGIRAASATPVEVGTLASVVGTMRTNSNGERYIEVAAIATAPGTAVAPLGVPARSIGGGDFHYDPASGAGQMGADQRTGLNNVGLLISSWGVASYIDSRYFAIDGGDGLQVMCETPSDVFPYMDVVRVTGISSLKLVEGVPQPVVLVREWSTLLGGSISGWVSPFAFEGEIPHLVQSPHPYPNNYNRTWTVYKPAAATRFRLHFGYIYLSAGDVLSIIGADGTVLRQYESGHQVDVWSGFTHHSYVTLRLVTNASGQDYGFAMDRLECDPPGSATPIFRLTSNGRPPVDTVATFGYYLFAGLAAGEYQITPVWQDPHYSLQPSSRTVVVERGQDAQDINFTWQ